MNCVERVRAICAERKIPISRLERDLGFANGYIGQLRKGTFPADRLAMIADYLSLSTDYLLTGQEKENPATETGGLTHLIEEIGKISEPDDELIQRIILAYLSLTEEEKKAVKKLIDGFAEKAPE